MALTFMQGALMTIFTLFGGLALGLFVGNGVFLALPGSQIAHPLPGHIAIAALPALVGLLGGGAAWGVLMARFAGRTDFRRSALAGALGFGPITLVVGLVLGLVEPPLVEQYGASTGIHRIFTLLFVPSAFLIAGISAWAVGRGTQDAGLSKSLFWKVGLVSAAAFLAVNLGMHAAGWVVGAPGAADRMTMLTVMGLGNIGAALAGGGAMAVQLAYRRQAEIGPAE